MRRRFAMHSATMGPLNLLASIEVARLAEFDAFEIGGDKLAQHLAAGGTVDEVRDALRRAGIEALSFHAHEAMALPHAADEVPSLERSHQALCERVAALGCGMLIVNPPKLLDRAATSVWHDTTTRTLAGISRTAAAHGISVALEFVGTGQGSVQTLSEAREITGSASPRVGLVLDSFEFFAGASTWSMLDGIDAASIALVRLNDAESRPLENLNDSNRVLPGDGVVPMRELLRQVESVGYKGAYSIQLARPEYWQWRPERLARVALESIESVCAEKDEQEGLLDYD